MYIHVQVAKREEGVYNQYLSMLKFYTEKNPEPSWSGIVLAMQSPPMNLKLTDLPEEVQDRVKAGKLPCESKEIGKDWDYIEM